MDKKALYKETIQVFGHDAQLDMAIEEMSELIKEICKRKRHGNNESRIADEIADVEIMLEQIVQMLDVGKLKDAFKRKKLGRLQHRINVSD